MRRRRTERGLRERAARAVPREPGGGPGRVARALRERRERARRDPPGPRAAARARCSEDGNGHVATARHRRRRRRPYRRRRRPHRRPHRPPTDLLLGGVAAAMALVKALPHARPPRRAPRPARLRAGRRPGARAGAARAAKLTPELQAPHPGRRCSASTSPARRSPTPCRSSARPTAARSRTRSSTSPTTSSASGCARRSSRAATGSRSSADEKRRLLERLTEVEGFERYLRRAFLGQKQFSIEGLDVMVPMLDEAIELAAEAGAHEVVIGMAHRGRLNVLAHIARPARTRRSCASSRASGRSRRSSPTPEGGTGDVKYHLGAEGTRKTAGRRDHGHARLEPEPSRGGRPGRRGPHARRADRPLDPRRASTTRPSRCRS